MLMKVQIKVDESVEAEGLGVNDASFDMLRMVRVEVKVRLTIGGFSVKGGDKSPVFINRNLKIKIVNGGAAVLKGELDGRVERVEESFQFLDG